MYQQQSILKHIDINQRASCKYLTHKYASYFGCTVNEVFLIALIYLVFDLILSVLIALFTGMFFLIFVATFIVSYFLIRFTAKRVGQFKIGRQQNYIMLKMQQILNDKVGLDIPYIRRMGFWSTRRRL